MIIKKDERTVSELSGYVLSIQGPILYGGGIHQCDIN